MKLYGAYIKMHIRSKTEYRISFMFVLLSVATIPLLELLGIVLMFDRFGSIHGWTFYEVLLPFAVINFGASASEIVFRGFDRFSRLIRDAGFDRLLLRPRSLVLQVLGSECEIARVGRVATSLFFLWVALSHLPVEASAGSAGLVILMLFSSFSIFCGVYMLRATMCFWTVEGLEVMNILSDGGRTALQYPISIYNKVFRFFFTGVIPFAAANYYPLLVLLHKTEGHSALYALSPAAGFLFLIPCYRLWRVGLRHYASAGS